jgi:hypothetical protein
VTSERTRTQSELRRIFLALPVALTAAMARIDRLPGRKRGRKAE